MGSSGCPAPCPAGGDPASSDFCPAECDGTLQAGDEWFYIENWPLRPLAELQGVYNGCLGHNANLLLDIAPPPNSTVVAAHAAGYAALGGWIRGCYGAPVASAVLPAGATVLDLVLSGGAADRVRMVEDQRLGQIVRSYTVTVETAGRPGHVTVVASGTSIGAGKIDLFGARITAARLRLTVDAAPTGLLFEAFSCTE